MSRSSRPAPPEGIVLGARELRQVARVWASTRCTCISTMTATSPRAGARPTIRKQTRARSPQLLEEQQEKCACWARFDPYATESGAPGPEREHAYLRRGRGAGYYRTSTTLFVKSKRRDSLPRPRCPDIGHCTCANHEGVAERSDVRDYFRGAAVPVEPPLLTSNERRPAGMRWWRSRSKHGQYLLCYDCGKSAVKLVDDAGPARPRRRTPLGIDGVM